MSEPRLVKFIVSAGIIESTELIDGNYVYAEIPSYVYLATDVEQVFMLFLQECIERSERYSYHAERARCLLATLKGQP